MYPGIEKWFQNKVIPGMRTTERVGIIGYLDNQPAASAIVKRGESSKFCHLHLKDNARNESLGDLFFMLMAEKVRYIAEEIHFTLPESLWIEKKEFFDSFGFRDAQKSSLQYRLFEDELRCSARIGIVWASVLDKLPDLAKKYAIGGFAMNNGLLFSLHPNNANLILEGRKRVEIRKRFRMKWQGSRVNLYSSRPVASLVGEARISYIDYESPETIWMKYENEIGASKEDFDNYVGNEKNVYAIVLDEIKSYIDAIPVTRLSHLVDCELRPPQSYFCLDRNPAWSAAVSIAALLHGHKIAPTETNEDPDFFSCEKRNIFQLSLFDSTE